MGSDLVEEGQAAYGLDEPLVGVENDTNLRADLLQEPKCWSAHQHVAQCAHPHGMQLRPSVWAAYSQGPSDLSSDPPRFRVQTVGGLISVTLNLEPAVDPGLPHQR